MAVVNFTLSEEGVAVLHDALVCIQKFSDDVSLEVRKEKVSRSSGWLLRLLDPSF